MSLENKSKSLWIGASMALGGLTILGTCSSVTESDIEKIAKETRNIARNIKIAVECGATLKNPAAFPNTFRPSLGETMELSYSLTLPSNVTITLFGSTSAGVSIDSTIIPKARQGWGSHDFTWDGKDHRGKMTPPGRYLIIFESYDGKCSSRLAAGISVK